MSGKTSSSPTYPALRNLEAAQQQVAEELRDGFRETDDLFFWLQDLVVVTFGYVDKQLLDEAYTSHSLRMCLQTGEDFRAVSFDHLDPIDPKIAREFRLHLEEDLNAVFQKAYRDLRSNANEYVDAEGRPDPVADDAPVALRPSLERLNERQQVVLQELLDGFEDDEEILDWARRLNAATYGELPQRVITGLRGKERPLRDNLLNEENLEYASDHRDQFRYLFAATYLLPAFNDGVRTLTGAAGERSDVDDDEDSDYTPELGA